MPPMTNSKPIQLRVSTEIDTALRDYCAANGIELSDLLRDSALKAIGRKDLIGTMRGRGQPKKPKDE